MTTFALIFVWILSAVAQARIAPGQLVVERVKGIPVQESAHQALAIRDDEIMAEKLLIVVDQQHRKGQSEWAAESQQASQTGDDVSERTRGTQSSRSGDRMHIDDLVPVHLQDLVIQTANEFRLDPRMVAAVGKVESNWHEKEIGTHGDTGLMQILPDTGRWIADHLGLQSYNLSDPYTNLRMGAWYLSFLSKKWGNWNQALAEYNGGPAAGKQAGLSPNSYAKTVIRVYQG